ncbi:MAG: cobalamin-dependent protein [Candidatus Omnitrophica bacterium]|nr:cobalamin-dependent protein [Candidatus Omnitrophota bacterium]
MIQSLFRTLAFVLGLIPLAITPCLAPAIAETPVIQGTALAVRPFFEEGIEEWLYVHGGMEALLQVRSPRAGVRTEGSGLSREDSQAFMVLLMALAANRTGSLGTLVRLKEETVRPAFAARELEERVQSLLDEISTDDPAILRDQEAAAIQSWLEGQTVVTAALAEPPSIYRQMVPEQKSNVLFASTLQTADPVYAGSGRKLNEFKGNPPTRQFFHELLRRLHVMQFYDMQTLLADLRFPGSELYQAIHDGQLDAVCLSGYETQIVLLLQVADTIKAINPQMPVLVGGHITESFHPALLTQHFSIDIACRGLGEYVLPMLLKGLKEIGNRNQQGLDEAAVQRLMDLSLTRTLRQGQTVSVRLGDAAGDGCVAIRDAQGRVYVSGPAPEAANPGNFGKPVWSRDSQIEALVKLLPDTDLAQLRKLGLQFMGSMEPDLAASRFYPQGSEEWDDIAFYAGCPGGMAVIQLNDGCRHGKNCPFCPVGQRPLNRPGPDRVLDIIGEAVEEGATEVFLAADDVTGGSWLRRLAQGMRQRNLSNKVAVWAHSRVPSGSEIQEFVQMARDGVIVSNGIGCDGFTPQLIGPEGLGKAWGRRDRTPESYLEDARAFARAMIREGFPVQYNFIAVPRGYDPDSISLRDVVEGISGLSSFMWDLQQSTGRTLIPTFSVYVYPVAGAPLTERCTWDNQPTRVVFTETELSRKEWYTGVDENTGESFSVELHRIGDTWGELVPLREIESNGEERRYVCVFRPLYFSYSQDLKNLRDALARQYGKNIEVRRDLGLMQAIAEWVSQNGDDPSKRIARKALGFIEQMKYSFQDNERRSHEMLGALLRHKAQELAMAEFVSPDPDRRWLPWDQIYHDYGLEIHSWVISRDILKELRDLTNGMTSAQEYLEMLQQILAYFNQGKFTPSDAIRHQILENTESFLSNWICLVEAAKSREAPPATWTGFVPEIEYCL